MKTNSAPQRRGIGDHFCVRIRTQNGLLGKAEGAAVFDNGALFGNTLEVITSTSLISIPLNEGPDFRISDGYSTFGLGPSAKRESRVAETDIRQLFWYAHWRGKYRLRDVRSGKWVRVSPLPFEACGPIWSSIWDAASQGLDNFHEGISRVSPLRHFWRGKRIYVGLKPIPAEAIPAAGEPVAIRVNVGEIPGYAGELPLGGVFDLIASEQVNGRWG